MIDDDDVENDCDDYNDDVHNDTGDYGDIGSGGTVGDVDSNDDGYYDRKMSMQSPLLFITITDQNNLLDKPPL